MKKEGTEKIISTEAAAPLVADYKAKGKKVGCLSGSFDLMTGVHFKALYERSLKCDVLIVLLNSDSSIRTYKGNTRPYVSEDERSYVLAQSPHVSHIIVFDELTPVKLLDGLKPDIFFNVSEWGHSCVERPVVEKNGGEIMLFDFDIPASWHQSSSELIGKIVEKSTQASNKAIFLDRDGVINENKEGYVHRREDFEFIPGVLESLKKISASEYKLLIVTNQSGIGRGLYMESDVHKLHQEITELLAAEGITVDGIYFCPHHPDDSCECRKPGSKLFLQAVQEHDLDLSKSWFVGDSLSDIEAGQALNLKTVQVNTTSESNTQYTAKDLYDAIHRHIKL